MDSLSAQSARAEEARIRAAYAKRYANRQQGARYSFFRHGFLFEAQEEERQLLALLRRHGCAPLDRKKILEIGCGDGYWLREFIKWGARPEHITGVDLRPESVAEARRLCPEAVTVHCGSAAELTFPDAAFDLVCQFTVFTSVLDSAVKQQIAAEMLRVVKGDGRILWYDFYIDNPWNADVRSVKKREIYQLFPGCRIKLRRITLLPPLVRLLAPYSWLACYLIGRIPWLCTHYLGAIRKENT